MTTPAMTTLVRNLSGLRTRALVVAAALYGCGHIDTSAADDRVSCSDDRQNGDETGVDCGGGCAAKCTASQGCSRAEDCESGSCAQGVCAPSCSDGNNGGCSALAACANTPAARICTCPAGLATEDLACAPAKRVFGSIGPFGGDIVEVLVVKNATYGTEDVLAASRGVIFKSTDLAETWKTVDLPAASRIFAFVAHPSAAGVVYAAARGGLFKSSDAGSSWQPTSLTHDVHSIAIDPIHPENIYVGAEADGNIYKSSDGGLTFAKVHQIAAGVTALAVDPNDSRSVLAGGADGTISASPDGGTTWTELPSPVYGPAVNGLVVLTGSPRTILVSHVDYGISSSTNNGASWVPRGPQGCIVVDLDGHSISTLRVSPDNVIYASCRDLDGQGIQESTDRGETWQSVATPAGERVNAIAFGTNPYAIYAGLYGSGVMRAWRFTADDSFSLHNQGLAAAQIDALAIDPSRHDRLFVAARQAGLFRSADGGASWSDIGGQIAVLAGNLGHRLSMLGVGVDPADPQIVIACAGAIYRSSDGGDHWALVDENKGCRGETAAVEDGTLFVSGDSGGVLRSTDHGLSWTIVNNGLGGFNVWALAADKAGLAIYVVGDDGESSALFKSTTAGTMWTKVGSFPVGHARSVAIHPTAHDTVYVSADTSGLFDDPGDSTAGIYKSTDGGATWAQVAQTAFANLAVDRSNPTVLYAAAGPYYRRQLRVSLDEGNTWRTMTNDGFPAQTVSLRVDPADPLTIYAETTGHGVYKAVLAN